jgi:predicted MFS family arabinose efflux permease
MMTIGGLGAMLANLWMGGSVYFEMFVVAWLANGYFQAMGYPSTLKLVVNWFKPQEQGRAVGASEFAQSLASILILPLAGWLAVQYSWRLVFFVPALLMGVVSVWYWTQARDHPLDWDEVQEDKPLLRDMLARYRAALGDWRLVSADLSYGASQFVRYAMITWIPLYLVQTTGLGIFKAALAGAMFQVGGALGSLLVGWLADLPLFQPRRWAPALGADCGRDAGLCGGGCERGAGAGRADMVDRGAAVHLRRGYRSPGGGLLPDARRLPGSGDDGHGRGLYECYRQAGGLAARYHAG